MCSGKIVNAVDGSALVAAGDDEGARDAREGMIDDLGEGRFPFTANRSDVDFVLANEAVDEGAFADRSNDDEITARRRCGLDEGRGQAGYALEVVVEIVGGAQDARPVSRVGAKFSGAAAVRERKAAGGIGGPNILGLADGPGVRGERCQGKQGAERCGGAKADHWGSRRDSGRVPNNICHREFAERDAAIEPERWWLVWRES